MTDDIFLINDHVRRPRSDIHHGDSFLLFVGRQHGLGRSDRIQEKPERNDIHPFEGHLQPVDRDRIAQYDVERRRQFVAERPDRIGRLLLVVDKHNAVQGHGILLPAGGSPPAAAKPPRREGFSGGRPFAPAPAAVGKQGASCAPEGVLCRIHSIVPLIITSIISFSSKKRKGRLQKPALFLGNQTVRIISCDICPCRSRPRRR